MNSLPDAQDLEALIRDREWVVSLARGLVRGDDAVEDVVQQAYLRALLYLPPGAQRARGWMAQVLRNVARRRWRNELSERQRREGLQAARAGDTHPEAAELAEQLELQQRLAECVLRLEEPYRSVILLRYYDDLSPREIADRLHRPLETVRTQLKRAIGILRLDLDRGETSGREPWRRQALALLGSASAVKHGRSRGAETSEAGLPRGRHASSRPSWGLPLVAATFAAAVGTSALVTLKWASMGAEQEASSADGKGGMLGLHGGAVSRAASADQPAQVRRSSPVEPLTALGPEGRAISGRVITAEAMPVEGATVFIRTYVDSTWLGGSTTTPEDGSFRIECEEQQAQAAHVSGDSAVLWFPEIEVHAPGLATFRADIEPGRTTLDPWKQGAEVVLPDITVERGTAVSGRVVAALDGSAIADAEIFLCTPDETTDGLVRCTPAGRTADDGSFVMPFRLMPVRKAPWKYYVVARSRTAGAAWTPLTPDSANPSSIVELRVPPPASLDVTIVDWAGRPVAGAIVMAVPVFAPLGSHFDPLHSEHEPGEHGWECALLMDQISGKSDADGNCRLGPLPLAASAGFDNAPSAGASGGAFVLCAGIADQCHGDSEIVVLSGGAEKRTVPVAPVGAPRVRLSGSVTDCSGAPIAGAAVGLAITSYAKLQVHANDDGRFDATIDCRHLDSATCRAEAPGFAPREESVTLQRGEARTLDFTLCKCLPISGRLVDTEGLPVRAAVVRASPADPSVTQYPIAPDRIDAGIRMPPRTDETGQFTIPNATAGAWKLTAWAPEQAQWEESSSLVAQGGQSDVVLTLHRTSRVLSKLVVRAKEIGRDDMVELCAVEVTRGEDGPSGEHIQPEPVLSSDRREVEISSVEPGPWRIWALAVGGAVGYVDVDVSALDGGRLIERTVLVGESGTLAGTVAGTSGGVVQVNFRGTGPPLAWPIERQWFYSVGFELTCDASGEFRATGAPRGVYELLYQSETLVASAVHEVRASSTSDVHLRPTGGVCVDFDFGPPQPPVAIDLEYGEHCTYHAYIDGLSPTRALILPAGSIRWTLWPATRPKWHPKTTVRSGSEYRAAGDRLVIDCRSVVE